MTAAIAYAQTGTLTGIATDTKHHPVGQARVSLQSAKNGNSQTGTTDASGRFRFAATPGSYTIRAEDDELDSATAGPLTVSADKMTTVDLVLQPQYFDEPEFTVAGVTNNTYRGGHGADTVLRSSEVLTKETAALTKPNTAEQNGRPLQAAQELQRAAQADPSEANLFDWGTELLSHRAPEPGIEIFRKGVHRYPRSTRMLLGLASAEYAAGLYEQAAESFFRATDLDPLDPKPYLFLAQVQRREITETPGYEERLARFAKLHPESALADYDYAVTLQIRNQDAEAAALLKKSLGLDSRFAPAHLQLGIVYAAQGKVNQAIAEYQKALDIDPDLEEAHYRLAEAYRVTGDRQRAAVQLARYNELARALKEKLERERREVQQFVISLKNQ